MIVFHDITTVKTLEAVRREFVANVSHEFRTPLAIINGYIETLLDGAIEDRATAEEWLRVMAKNGRRLTLLIEDLLTLSHLEYRSPQLDFQKVNLPRAPGSRQSSASRLRFRNVKGALWWSGARLLTWADADSLRMEQVFENLLENAIRHAIADEVVITIKAQSVGEEIEIVFCDNGPGIPYGDQPHIFERFYRVHKDRSACRGRHGPRLVHRQTYRSRPRRLPFVVESVPGQGAAFKIRLPAAQQTPTQAARSS